MMEQTCHGDLDLVSEDIQKLVISSHITDLQEQLAAEKSSLCKEDHTPDRPDKQPDSRSRSRSCFNTSLYSRIKLDSKGEYLCSICLKVHKPSQCTYLTSLPQGAEFGPGYDVVCRGCNHVFNEDRWFCTSCGSNRAKLRLKICFICNCAYHDSADCPEDKVQAAQYKVILDEMRARVPYKISNPHAFPDDYVPTFPDGYVPTPVYSVSDEPT